MAKNDNKADLIKDVVKISEEAKRIEKIVAEVTAQYETLINYLKPLMTHEMLVAFTNKKKEIFG